MKPHIVPSCLGIHQRKFFKMSLVFIDRLFQVTHYGSLWLKTHTLWQNRCFFYFWRQTTVFHSHVDFELLRGFQVSWVEKLGANCEAVVSAYKAWASSSSYNLRGKPLVWRKPPESGRRQPHRDKTRPEKPVRLVKFVDFFPGQQTFFNNNDKTRRFVCRKNLLLAFWSRLATQGATFGVTLQC